MATVEIMSRLRYLSDSIIARKGSASAFSHSLDPTRKWGPMVVYAGRLRFLGTRTTDIKTGIRLRSFWEAGCSGGGTFTMLKKPIGALAAVAGEKTVARFANSRLTQIDHLARLPPPSWRPGTAIGSSNLGGYFLGDPARTDFFRALSFFAVSFFAQITHAWLSLII